jgi:hypothetical protein
VDKFEALSGASLSCSAISLGELLQDWSKTIVSDENKDQRRDDGVFICFGVFFVFV